jgi:protein-S-isoprenylcysteine O-methyltransferase Ste14
MMFLRFALPATVVLVVLFVSAGRVDVWPFWAYVSVMYVVGATTYTALARLSPGLLAERLQPPTDRDRVTRRMVGLPFVGHLVLAGLDVRFGWSTMPSPLVYTGLAIVACAFLLVSWTLLANPFASSAVRMQRDRDQHVVSTGPYALVRHPMYLAVLLVCLGGGPALGSWWAGLVLLLSVVPVFVRRTLIEDAMLKRDLPGYAEYSGRVRWKALPGVF